MVDSGRSQIGRSQIGRSTCFWCSKFGSPNLASTSWKAQVTWISIRKKHPFNKKQPKTWSIDSIAIPQKIEASFTPIFYGQILRFLSFVRLLIVDRFLKRGPIRDGASTGWQVQQPEEERGAVESLDTSHLGLSKSRVTPSPVELIWLNHRFPRDFWLQLGWYSIRFSRTINLLDDVEYWWILIICPVEQPCVTEMVQ